MTMLDETITARRGLDVEDDPLMDDRPEADPDGDNGPDEGEPDAYPADPLAAHGPGLTSIYFLVPRDVLVPRPHGEPPTILGTFGDPAAAMERSRELGSGYVVARLRMTAQPGPTSAAEALRRTVDRQRGQTAIDRAVAAEAVDTNGQPFNPAAFGQ
jgi:hypothetical protein